MHTTDGCSITGSDQSATLDTTNCFWRENGNSGCGSKLNATTIPNNYGKPLNDNGGGVYVTEWTSSYVKHWFFPRGAVPPSIASGSPDISQFGKPTVNQQGPGCTIDEHFANMNIIINTDFCGDWAGNVYASFTTCPQNTAISSSWDRCVDYVGNNPTAFTEAYWDFNSIRVYQMPPGVEPVSSYSTSLSSTQPLPSTNTIDAGMGRSSSSMSSEPYTGPLSSFTPTPSVSDTKLTTTSLEPSPQLPSDEEAYWSSYRAMRTSTTPMISLQPSPTPGDSSKPCPGMDNQLITAPGGRVYRVYCSSDTSGPAGGIITIQTFPAGQDYDSCFSLCSEEASCTAFTWEVGPNGGGQCVVKRGAQYPAANSERPDLWSFLLVPDGPASPSPKASTCVDGSVLDGSNGRRYTVFCPGDTTGATLDSPMFGSGDYKQCITACDANSACGAWTWIPYDVGGICFLKSGAQTRAETSNDRAVGGTLSSGDVQSTTPGGASGATSSIGSVSVPVIDTPSSRTSSVAPTTQSSSAITSLSTTSITSSAMGMTSVYTSSASLTSISVDEDEDAPSMTMSDDDDDTPSMTMSEDDDTPSMTMSGDDDTPMSTSTSDDSEMTTTDDADMPTPTMTDDEDEDEPTSTPGSGSISTTSTFVATSMISSSISPSASMSVSSISPTASLGSTSLATSTLSTSTMPGTSTGLSSPVISSVTSPSASALPGANPACDSIFKDPWGESYLVKCSTDSFGTSFRTVQVYSGGFGTCFGACDSTQGCAGFTYVGNDVGNCYLKNTPGTLYPANNDNYITSFKLSALGYSSTSQVPSSRASNSLVPGMSVSSGSSSASASGSSGASSMGSMSLSPRATTSSTASSSGMGSSVSSSRSSIVSYAPPPPCPTSSSYYCMEESQQTTCSSGSNNYAIQCGILYQGTEIDTSDINEVPPSIDDTSDADADDESGTSAMSGSDDTSAANASSDMNMAMITKISKRATLPDVASCRALCDRTTGCKAFNFVGTDCTLFSSVTGYSYAPGALGGTVYAQDAAPPTPVDTSPSCPASAGKTFTDSTSMTYNIVCYTQYASGYTSDAPFASDNLANCLPTCSRNAQCAGVAFDTTTRLCQLLAPINGAQTNNNNMIVALRVGGPPAHESPSSVPPTTVTTTLLPTSTLCESPILHVFLVC